MSNNHDYLQNDKSSALNDKIKKMNKREKVSDCSRIFFSLSHSDVYYSVLNVVISCSSLTCLCSISLLPIRYVYATDYETSSRC